MKHMSLPRCAARIALALLILLCCFFRNRLLPLTGALHIIASIAAFLLAVWSILTIYRAVCGIVSHLDP